ncbi:hypothetical protein EON67_12475, partial [archaeon]
LVGRHFHFHCGKYRRRRSRVRRLVRYLTARARPAHTSLCANARPCFRVQQPMDFIKTQLQLAGEGTRKASTATPLSVAKHAIATEGVGKLYTGITAAWLRQIVYGSARLGLFRVFSDELKVTTGLRTCTRARRRANAYLGQGGSRACSASRLQAHMSMGGMRLCVPGGSRV